MDIFIQIYVPIENVLFLLSMGFYINIIMLLAMAFLHPTVFLKHLSMMMYFKIEKVQRKKIIDHPFPTT